MISDQALTDIPKIGDVIKIQKISRTEESNVPAGRVNLGILKSLAIGYEIEVLGDKAHYQGKYDGQVILTTTPVMQMTVNEDGSIDAQTFTSVYRLELETSRYQEAIEASKRNFQTQIQSAFRNFLR